MTAIIAYRNLADGAELSGPSLPGFPLQNLQERSLGTVWRASGSTASITIPLGSWARVRCVALLGINSIPGGTAPILKVEGSFNGTVFTDLGEVYDLDRGCPDLPRSAIWADPEGWTGPEGGFTPDQRRVRITCQWPRPDGSTWWQAARLWVSDALVLPDGFDGQWVLRWADTGRVAELPGAAYPDVGVRRRELTARMSLIGPEIAFGADESYAPGFGPAPVPSLQDMFDHVGATGNVLVLPRLEQHWRRRLGIYGRLTPESLGIEQLSGSTYASDLTVIEER